MNDLKTLINRIKGLKNPWTITYTTEQESYTFHSDDKAHQLLFAKLISGTRAAMVIREHTAPVPTVYHIGVKDTWKSLPYKDAYACQNTCSHCGEKMAEMETLVYKQL